MIGIYAGVGMSVILAFLFGRADRPKRGQARRTSAAAPGLTVLLPEMLETITTIVVVVLLGVPLVLVGALFVWAAVRDGREDQAVQRRLGIKRKTRLGR